MHFDDEEGRLIDWAGRLPPEVKVAQLLMVAPDPTDDAPAVIEWLAENQYGGLFVDWRHLTERDWIVELAERMREMTDDAPPPFLATDEEGGLVSDVAALTRTAPSPAALSALNRSQLTYSTALAMGEKLKALGFNLVFAPCLDINCELKNPVIGTRSFGSTPDQVIKHGLATIEGFARSGVVACVKHFPGHGATRLDSHMTLPQVDASKDTLRHRELLPFRAAVDGGIPMVMMAHVAYPALDPTGSPATLSPEIMTELLRQEMGFSGVVISDSMEMEGVSGSGDPGSVAIQALEAGVDILLYAVDRDMAAQVAERMTWALKQGELSEDRVLESLLRVGRLRMAIADSLEAIDESTRDEILDYQHEALLQQVSAEGITLIGGKGPDIPLAWENRRGLWVLPTGTKQRLIVDSGALRDLVAPLGMELVTVDLSPGDSERDGVVRRAERADYIVACTLSRGSPSVDQRKLIDGLVATEKPIILVSLLDSYDLNDFPTVPTRLATHGFGPLVMQGLVDVLLGRKIPNAGGVG